MVREETICTKSIFETDMMISEEKTFYEMLGVDRGATTEEIKEAYREIARVLHPDSNYYDEIMEYDVSNQQLGLFKTITAAYHTLINKEKRLEYDATLPPELKGWVDEDDEQAEIDAKLVELGLKDPSEAKAQPKKKPKSATLDTFGKISDEPVEDVTPNKSAKVSLTRVRQSSESREQTSQSSRPVAAQPHPRSSPPSQALHHTHPHATNFMGVGRASALSSHQVQIPNEPRSSNLGLYLLYLLAVGVPFLVGVGLVAFLLSE